MKADTDYAGVSSADAERGYSDASEKVEKAEPMFYIEDKPGFLKRQNVYDRI